MVDYKSEYEFKPDCWYYGENTVFTNENIVSKMAQALVKFKKDQEEDQEEILGKGNSDSFEELSAILDAWFEHDSLTEKKFDHLVHEDNMDDFVHVVVKVAKNKWY